MGDDSELKILCSIRCMDPCLVRDARKRLNPNSFEKVSYRCHLSGQQVQIFLIGEKLAAGLVEVAAEIGEFSDARIVAGLYSAELCECDVATLTSLPETESVKRLRMLSENGALSHRELNGMNYYRLESASLRKTIEEIISHGKN